MNSNQTVKGIKHIYNNDVKIARIIDSAGTFELNPHKNYYFSLLKAIVGQQLSVKAAASINKKFFLFFKGKPSTHKILSTEDLTLRNLGLSWAKVKYVKDLSQKIIYKEISFKNINNKSNEEIISYLTKGKGIGNGTVHMFLIFTVGRLTVLPVNDFGLKNAIKNLYGLRTKQTENKIQQSTNKNGWNPNPTMESCHMRKSLEI